MNPEVIIAVEISDFNLSTEILRELEQIPDVTAMQWFDPMAEKGAVSTQNAPHVILIHDEQSGDDIFERIFALLRAFPNSAVFILSEDMRPERIIAVMKAGVSEYFQMPMKHGTLTDAVEKIRQQLTETRLSSGGETFAFLSSKGGLGATALAVNTAIAFSTLLKESTVLMDMSLQSGDSSVLLDSVPRHTIYDACTNMHRLDAAFLSSILVSHSSGIEFLAAPTSPEQHEDISALHVRQILQILQKLYRTVIIDCASMQVNDCALEVFNVATKIFLITDLSVTSIRDASRLMQLLLKLGVDQGKIEIVVNRFIKGGELGLQDVEKTLKKQVFWLFPNDYENVFTSINTGIPLVSSRPRCPFSRSIGDFVGKLRRTEDQKIQDSAKKYRGLRTFFGRAF